MATKMFTSYGLLRHFVRLPLAVAGIYYLAPTVTTPLLTLSFLSMCWRLFAFHGGGHRYFAHKSFDCPPWLCNLFAFTIMSTEIGTIFYWIFLHEYHHHHCDRGTDIHSPHHNGFWTVQLGLHNDNLYNAVMNRINREKLKSGYGSDLSWITIKSNLLIFFGEVIILLVLSRLLGYRTFELYYWLCLLPRLYTVHAAALTNSVGHWYGSRPYTGNGKAPFGSCMATNCWWGALLNGGECWHNNHHAFSLSARHGLLFWEIDTTWLFLRLMAYCGFIWNVVEVSEEVRLAPRNSKDWQIPDNKYTIIHAKSGKSA